MKLADNTKLSSTDATLAAHIEQPVQEVEQKELITNFFVIGGIINITMILAYFVWAFRQWKKIDAREEQQGKE